MKILGIDPGFARIGYGIISKEGNTIDTIEFGCITTEANTDFSERLVQISEDLECLINKYKPDQLAIETLYFFKNAKTVISVAAARGVLILIPKKNNIPVFEYTPLQIKQAVTGYGKAEKMQVMSMVKSILKINSCIKLDDTSDALAVSICHASTIRTPHLTSKVIR